MYSTIESVIKKIDRRTLIQLLNDEVRSDEEINLNDAQDPIVLRFNEAAGEAGAIINSYLRGRYSLPFSVVPLIIISISDELTKYNCYKRRGDIPESIQNIYKANITVLERIEAGKMDIGIPGEQQNLISEIKTNKSSHHRIFNDDDVWDKY
jgi:phage gp36-like protein